MQFIENSDLSASAEQSEAAVALVVDLTSAVNYASWQNSDVAN